MASAGRAPRPLCVLDPAAIEDIVAVCGYTVSAP